ncbi:MAG: hypothetical protein Q7S02_05670 [bacterium]|nr:hypothetical protein [bacterium]
MGMDTRAILTWFDLFDWPLTPAEIPDSRFQIPDSLITEGFICSSGRERLVLVRRRKAILAWRKYRKARRWARVLACVPWVRMIAIGNDLGYGNCSDASDIDLVIITAPKRVWFVRLCVVTLLRLFRQRPGEHTRDAICPSFFLTTEAMDLESLQLPPQSSSRAERAGGERSREISHEVPRDPYLLFWVTQLTVLFDRDGTYDAFWRANEQWVRRWLPDARPRAIHPRLCVGAPLILAPHAPPPTPPLEEGERTPGGSGGKQKISPLPPQWRGAPARLWRERGRWIGSAIEHWCRRFQERRFAPEVRALVNRDTRVIATDRMLKFHTNDRRQEYHDRWLQRLRV